MIFLRCPTSLIGDFSVDIYRILFVATNCDISERPHARALRCRASHVRGGYCLCPEVVVISKGHFHLPRLFIFITIPQILPHKNIELRY